MFIGIHATWDVYNCNKEKLSFVPYVEETLHTITATLDLEELNEAFKQFEPIGVTGFILLAESHISIHTWPEHNYAAVDVFSCKNFDTSLVTKLLEKLFESDKIELNKLKRGSLELVNQLKLTSK
ncbi:adenosylmethionine decarboxylase [Cellulophaga baltica]|uniref:adenosylmethionine decarboxylase n=1 Tax=Cellulophaga TaxID=104264 RepID=UPI001C074EA6|nr:MULTISPECIES: adenosylmethionine decarboxylase [Cellulophaga]MBU2994883.1 adenosylmethionine decarboxylase [Cellulophaga baltica]MDO6766277.1 adenosylmethionine decarboxylase [Cellulophaga sp. 1_MG-2023]